MISLSLSFRREWKKKRRRLSFFFWFFESLFSLPPARSNPPAVRSEVQAPGRPDVGVDGPRDKVREPDEGPPRPPCRWRRGRRRRRRGSDSSRFLSLGALVVALSGSPVVVVDLGMLVGGRWLAAGARPDAQRALLRRGHRGERRGS